MVYNTTGIGNTADGWAALFGNVGGNYNTAVGFEALLSNTGGIYNTAVGYLALSTISSGSRNVALGGSALQKLTSGNGNAALGQDALDQLPSGSNNIAVGRGAGNSITLADASNDIEIGNSGGSSDNGVIRIGEESVQSATYIAGIYDTLLQPGSLQVYVNSSGQLSVGKSSERYKTDIAPMGSDAGKLMRLRPVTFRLKTDPSGALQYGLIAEEVDKVYPELVVRDATGKIQGVRYDELAPLLLNEVQRLQAAIDKLSASDARVSMR